MNTAIKDKTKEKVFETAVNLAYKRLKKDPQKGMMAVSYTHLTLPTKA